jgi:hypothetical protein
LKIITTASEFKLAWNPEIQADFPFRQIKAGEYKNKKG